MGFSDGSLYLINSNDGVYYPGQVFQGRLEFDLEKIKTFRGIYVVITGSCKVHWTTDHTRREGDRDIDYTVSHDSHEYYLNVKQYLVGGPKGEHQLHPGKHSFPFECQLPIDCPSSYEGTYGHIRYGVRVVVDRAFKFDQEKEADFRVVAPVDLNMIPAATEPHEFEFDQSFCCCCMGYGSASTLVKLPYSGFCPGQTVPIEVSCSNNSSIDIDDIEFSINKGTTYTAAYEPGQKFFNHTLAELRKGPIPGNTTRNWVVELEISDDHVYNLNACNYIKNDYSFKVKVSPSGCHSSESQMCVIFIGTIPLQQNIINQFPSSEQINQNVPNVTSPYPPAIVNQPLPSFPNGFPGGNPPAYQPNPLYPGSNPPYPGSNPPYPGLNPPYPGSNPPYPGGPNISPYPSPKPPYPNSPYPQTAPNIPYPGGNPSPYLSRSNPNLNVPTVGSNLVKSGSVGFRMPGFGESDNPTVPLLPPGAAVPYPPRGPSPAPSAPPAPASPDDAQTNKTIPEAPTADMETPCPAYNPNYHENDKQYGQ